MPSREPSPLNRYLAHLEKGELAYQFSPDAGRAVFYPRLLCPFTGSASLEWRISKGTGTVHATTVVHPAQGTPYNVALIDCDEGFRLMSRVEGIDPMQVKIGQRVRFRVHRPGGDDPPCPVFIPAENV
ncbi:MAG TPA: OB-fold domain-containing protein [Hyphomicrobiaceae bacterium]|nr:OB-fold domain-containing protein [Hyphomicrobiaceae bacterium]